jgi:hypothetical protein
MVQDKEKLISRFYLILVILRVERYCRQPFYLVKHHKAFLQGMFVKVDLGADWERV